MIGLPALSRVKSMTGLKQNDPERGMIVMGQYEKDFLEIKTSMTAQMADLDDFTLKFRAMGQLIDKILDKYNLQEA